MIERLNESELKEAMRDHPEWGYNEHRCAFHRDLKLKDFSEAFALMTRIAMAAEKADHHPEWSNVYNRLSIALTTHDAGGVTRRDVAMMEEIDAMTGK